MSLQQVPARGQVVRCRRQVHDDWVDSVGPGVGHAGRGLVQALPRAAQGKPCRHVPRPGAAFRPSGKIRLIGQIGEVARQRRDQAIELLDDTALGVVGQVAAEGHRGGDVIASRPEELTEDRGDGHRVISWQIRPAASAAS
jgi:hypothetical protein